MPLFYHTVLYVWSLKFARIVFSPQQHTTKQHCCECEEISAIYRQCSEIYRWRTLYDLKVMFSYLTGPHLFGKKACDHPLLGDQSVPVQHLGRFYSLARSCHGVIPSFHTLSTFSTIPTIDRHCTQWFGSYLNPHATSGDDTSAKLSLRHPFTTAVQWHLLILAFLGLKRLFVLLTLCSSALCH